MAQWIYGINEPPEYAGVDSFEYKRWFDHIMEHLRSTIKLVTVTAAYTIPTVMFYVRADATSSAFAVTLPPARNMQGRRILVKKIDASGNAVTVTAAGSDTIEGSATAALAARWDKVHLISNGIDGWEKL